MPFWFSVNYWSPPCTRSVVGQGYNYPLTLTHRLFRVPSSPNPTLVVVTLPPTSTLPQVHQRDSLALSRNQFVVLVPL